MVRSKVRDKVLESTRSTFIESESSLSPASRDELKVGIMAAARQVGMEVSAENSNDAWPKWKIGLAVGAPIAVVLGGLWYVRRRRRNQIN